MPATEEISSFGGAQGMPRFTRRNDVEKENFLDARLRWFIVALITG